MHLKVLWKKRDECRAWKIYNMEIKFIAMMMTGKLKYKIKR